MFFFYKKYPYEVLPVEKRKILPCNLKGTYWRFSLSNFYTNMESKFHIISRVNYRYVLWKNGFCWPTNLDIFTLLFIIFSSLSMPKLSTWPQPSLLLQIERICQINQDYIIKVIPRKMSYCTKMSDLRLQHAVKRQYITSITYITHHVIHMKCNYYS